MTHTTHATLPDVIDAVKALAHPGRLRILAMLRGGDLCVCQVTAALGLAASTVSSHLSDLRRAGFVTERKIGKWVRYHVVAEGPLSDLARQALRLAEADEQVGKDVRAVRALRKIPLEVLCSTGFDRKAVGAVPAPAPKQSRRHVAPARRCA
ncbi:MAG: metalloregulator ArsR/SmtB family transcription factor [Acidobacteria bacterium]|nr:metalloregulator ArsR/SmtB family transcription factor [Acidobacteriota bacterium]